MVQLNYQQLADGTRAHRNVCQRIIRDLIAALGVHILYGRTLKIDWGRLGQVRTVYAFCLCEVDAVIMKMHMPSTDL